MLNAFPFHAAGPYEGVNGKSKYLLDDYISSYAPTLTSLISPRSSTGNRKGKMLFVGDTKLLAAIKERDAIRRARRINTQLLDEAQGLIDMGNSDGPWRSIRLTGMTTAAALDISLGGEGQGSTFTHSSF